MSEQKIEVEVEVDRLGQTSRALVWISAIIFVGILVVTSS